MRTTPLYSLLIYSLLILPHAASKDRYPTFTTPSQAGPDFAIQGEYVGLLGDTIPVAAQVIALDQGKFEGVMFRGGLPGAGWDGSHRSYFTGESKDGVVFLRGIQGYELAEKNDYWQATIKNGMFSGTDLTFRNQSPDVSFEMKKVLRKSPTLGAQPPAGATILFDGTNTDAWRDAKIVEDNLLAHGSITQQSFKNHRIHLEFRTPFMPSARGMHRGNSGVLVRNKFEIQVVDSFGWTFINRRFARNSWVGRSGGIEELIPPKINMSYPPLSWQTYDIQFFMPQYDQAGSQLSPPMMTVRHNGTLIHDRSVLPPEAGTRPDNDPGQLYLQEHHDRVVYQNIWVVEAKN